MYFSTRVWVLSRLPYHGATAGTRLFRSRRDTLGAPARDSARAPKPSESFAPPAFAATAAPRAKTPTAPAQDKNSDFSVDLANKYSTQA
ncbi:hypothetical protein A33K_15070 [Burkholderia humptydooensis MSMB43]|uniref:Uncharacterized protein n=1 Tax=Burkholderia humptydooensis MSMB43 TaxID=441157 RepID=A0ABN0G9W8_9BURK|nr:hypothetical protein A33K_15070 [Burkholderia humptydooensis MSMB43]